MTRMRLDMWLVSHGGIPTRSKAQALIQSGQVKVKFNNGDEVSAPKASLLVSEVDQVIIEDDSLLKYVSRAGLKLEAALEAFHISVENKVVLDIGQSTGGFTDCLLDKLAQMVIGVDVGQDQLHPSLRSHEKVRAFEKLNVKDLSSNTVFKELLKDKTPELIVADVSFISLTYVIQMMTELFPKGENIEGVFLVKPQFELSSQALNKKGIVYRKEDLSLAEQKIKSYVSHCGWVTKGWMESPLLGKDGNKEFFIYVHR